MCVFDPFVSVERRVMNSGSPLKELPAEVLNLDLLHGRQHETNTAALCSIFRIVAVLALKF